MFKSDEAFSQQDASTTLSEVYNEVKGYSKKTSFFKIGSAMLIQMAKGQLFPNP